MLPTVMSVAVAEQEPNCASDFVPRTGSIASSSPPAKAGGAEGSRTPDLLIANETLYQLSYDPIQNGHYYAWT